MRVCESTAIEGMLVMVSVHRTARFAALLVHSLAAEYRILNSALENTKIGT